MAARTLQLRNPRPYFAELPYYLWGLVNYDSEGDCRRPTDRQWTWIYLQNRETREVVDVKQDEDGRWRVLGDDDQTTARLATFLLDREVDPMVRHGDVEIRFRRCRDGRTPARSSPTGVVIECDDCQPWADRMYARGLEPGYSTDVGQPTRLEYWIKDGFYVAFEQPDAG